MLFSILFIVIIAATAVISAMLARKQTWIGGAIRTGIIILSAVISVFISKLVGGSLGESLYSGFLSQAIGTLSAAADQIPILSSSIEEIVALLISPAIFLAVFPIVRLILGIVYKLFEKKLVTPRFADKKSDVKFARPIVGAFNGILIALIMLSPVCGYLSVVDSSVDAFDSDKSYEQELAIDESGNKYDALAATSETSSPSFLEDTTESAVFKITDTLGTPIFYFLTTSDIPTGQNDDAGKEIYVKFSVKEETANVLELTNDLALFVDDFSSGQVKPDTKTKKDNLVRSFSNSEFTRFMASDSVSSMSEKWLKNEDFIGVKSPDVPAIFDPTFTAVLETSQHVTYYNVDDDMGTIFDVFYHILEGDLLKSQLSAEELMVSMGERGTLDNITLELEKNTRYAHLTGEISDLSVRVVATAIGKADLGASPSYDKLVTDIATPLTETIDLDIEERKEIVSEKVHSALTEYDGISSDIPKNVVDVFTDKLVSDMTNGTGAGSDGVITNEEFHEYLNGYIVE